MKNDIAEIYVALIYYKVIHALRKAVDAYKYNSNEARNVIFHLIEEIETFLIDETNPFLNETEQYQWEEFNTEDNLNEVDNEYRSNTPLNRVRALLEDLNGQVTMVSYIEDFQ